MATSLSAFLFVTMVAGKVVHIPLDNSAEQVVALEKGMAVVTSSSDRSCFYQVLAFDDEATRNGGEPTNVLKSYYGWQRLLVMDSGAVAIGAGGCHYVQDSSSVEIYDAPALMSGSDPRVVLSGLSAIDVMANLPGGGLVVQNSIFGSQALVTGGNATTVLDYGGQWGQVVPFQGGLVYLGAMWRKHGVNGDAEETLLVFDDDALVSGNDPDPALQIGGWGSAKWFIPENPCTTFNRQSSGLVFEDGTLAVLGTCGYGGQDKATLTLLEDVNLQAQTLRNSSFSMTKGANQLLMLPSGYVAVGVTTVYCTQGHVEIFEESTLRSGGEPSLVLQASGAVTSMAVLQDGRLAVSVAMSTARQCGNGAIDIFDINAGISENVVRVV